MLPYGTRGKPDADILIVGEAYGANEEQKGEPFVGASGHELTRMLREAGIDPDACFYTNVINKRPPQNDLKHFFYPTKEARAASAPCIRGLYPSANIMEGINSLHEVIDKVQPKVIIALGNYALWALTESGFKLGNDKGYKIPTGITSFRGSHLRGLYGNIPVLPTYHPAAILRKWDWRAAAVHDLRVRVPKALRGEWDPPPWDFILQPAFDQVMEYLYRILTRATTASSPILISSDIETLQGCIECVGIAASRLSAICVPIMSRNNPEGYWSAYEEFEIWKLLNQVLSHPNIEVVGQNFIYDFQYLWWFNNIKPQYKQDTMLAHHCCFPGTPLGLDYLSSMYCSYHCYWKDDGKEASKNHNDLERWNYNARDCVVTLECIEELWAVIKYYNLEWQYGFQMTRARAAIKMMMRGVRVDEKRRAEERVIHMEVSQAYENRMQGMMPESIWTQPPKKAPWYRSNDQLKTIFYDVLGVKPVLARNKDGSMRPTVNDEALTLIGRREPVLKPLTDTLSEYRSLETFGHFVNMRVGLDKRMRANFSPTTETFRYRSSADVFGSGRNLQNIPKGTEED